MKSFPGRSMLVATALVLPGALGLVVAPTAGGCAAGEHAGGDWRSYGHDLANSRHQPDEALIGTDTVADLAAAWTFSTGEAGGGVFDSTPVIADGCAYLGSSTGVVSALNADTGEPVWTQQLQGLPSDRGGAVVGAVGVHGDTVLVNVNKWDSPFLAALDRFTGEILWGSVYEDQDQSFSDTSVVLHDGLVFLGFSVSAEREPPGRGGFAILDADTGEVLIKTYTIPDEDFEAGFAGATIWGTAAVDVEQAYAYVGTSNPHSNKLEHEHANALLKIDLDRERGPDADGDGVSDTFGQIVASYKGRPEQYVDGLESTPACELLGDEPAQEYGAGFSLACLQLDLDFGASPNLFADDDGDLQVGALQKAGVYHAADAETMEPAWETVVGGPCLVCNAGSTAFDGERILGAAVPPGQMFALDTDGAYRWLTPIGDPVLHYQPTSSANGVVYNTDIKGNLNAFDAQSGLLLFQRRLADDAEDSSPSTAYTSAGIAVARNTVYVAAGDTLLAYRLP